MAKQNVVELIIEGNNISAVKSIDGTITKLDQLSNKANSISAGFNALKSSLGGIFAGLSFGAAITGLGSVIKATIDTADEFNKMSQKIGMSVESLSTLKYAADLNDVSMDTLRISLTRLSKTINDFSLGSKDAEKTIKALGLSVIDNNGKLLSIDNILLQIADKFKYMPDSVQKTVFAMELFGRSGAELIPLLNQGADGIAKLQEEAEKLGLQISTETAQKAEIFNDSIKRLNNSLQGLAYQTLPPLIDFLSQAAEGFIAANNAAANANNWFEFWSNLETNAIIEGIKNGQKFREDSFREAITSAAEQARIKMIGLSDIEVKLLAQQVQNKINALKKLEPTEDIKNDIAQLEAQLKVYQSRFTLTEQQKKKLEELKQIESQLSFEISIIGLNEFDRKLLEVNRKAEDLRKKFGPQSFINNWQKAKIAELMNNEIMKNADLTTSGLKNITKEFTEQNKELLEQKKKLEELKQIESQLSFETSIIGLNEFDRKLLEVNRKAEDLRKKFGPQSFIDNWQKANIAKLISDSFIETAEEQKRILQEQIKLEEYRRNMFIDSLGMMGESMLMFAQLSGSTNKSLFGVYKMFAIAQAVMNTYEGATKALAQGGIYGPFMAGAVIAFGMAQVAKIASTQPNNSGISGFSGNAAVSIPTSGLQSVINNTNVNNSNQKAINITVNVNSQVLSGTDLDKWVRDNLSQSINKAIEDGKIDFS